MEITEFTEAPDVVHKLDALHAYWQQKKPEVSDVVDDDGNQYVDLVMEGGGVLGIALLGYTYAMERVGIRFLGIGGTSAGAIVATLLAATDTPAKAKSTRILETLVNVDMFDFVDGDDDSKDFINAVLEGAGPVKLTWKALQVIDDIRDNLGLNPGDYFLEWVTEQLRNAGIRTAADLDSNLNELPSGLRLRDGKELSTEEAAACLKVVAADVTTETKAVFPEMAHLYFKQPQNTNPACFVRASMSIPLFFRPYRVRNLPKGVPALREWKEVGYLGVVPKEVFFVDGGIMSNFPIDLFHDSKNPAVPIAPTLGARLGTERSEINRTESVTQFLMSIFNSARHCSDFDFIARNPDFVHLVCEIPTGPHNWLDFYLTLEDKIDLFTRGVDAACFWLKQFNWPEYKRLRAKLAGV